MSNEQTPNSPTNEPNTTPTDDSNANQSDSGEQITVSRNNSSADQVPPSAESSTSTGVVTSNKPGWGRRVGLIVVILALLGGAVWAAMSLDSTAKPAVSTVTKKEVALLRVGGTEQFPTKFYPEIEGNTIDYDVNNQIFEGLTKFQDKTRVVPALAVSWSNPDTNTWVFKLRSGVKFHDGVAMTAQTVKDSLDATKGDDVLSTFNDTIKTVTVEDPSTVKIVTDGPDPLLLNKLTYLSIFDTKGKPNDAANGTGPYTLKPDTQPSDSSIKLTAFNGYYGDKVYVKEVEFVSYTSDDELLKDLQQNKLELGYLVDESLVAKAGSSFKEFETEAPTVAFMVPNTLKAGSPLANKAVRQALYTALDPVALLKSRGLSGAPATQPVPPAIPGYNPTIKRPAIDAANAKTLLAQAGYPNGFAFKLSYFTPAKSLALELQKELAAIGVTLNLDEQASGRDLQAMAFGGKTDAYYFTITSDLIDTSDIYRTLVFQQKNYSNPVLDKLDKEQSTTLDQAKRLKMLQQMNETFMADYGALPLYEFGGRSSAVQKNLHITQQNLNSYGGLLFSKVYGE